MWSNIFLFCSKIAISAKNLNFPSRKYIFRQYFQFSSKISISPKNCNFDQKYKFPSKNLIFFLAYFFYSYYSYFENSIPKFSKIKIVEKDFRTHFLTLKLKSKNSVTEFFKIRIYFNWNFYCQNDIWASLRKFSEVLESGPSSFRNFKITKLSVLLIPINQL